MKPIGVFDSGVGGLTVVRAIQARFPERPVVYLGDTARVPYGPKSPRTVSRFSRECGDFLAEHDIEALVVACNTASAFGLEGLEGRYDFPVLGVLEPGARAGLERSRGGAIGVLGTVGTVRSGAYDRAITQISPGRTVISKPAPLLVPLAEEGLVDHPATALLAHDYLLPLVEGGVDVVILACTHYPLLAPVLARILGPSIELVDSADAVAVALGDLLLSAREPVGVEGVATVPEPPAHTYFITDSVSRFQEVGARFLGAPLVPVRLACISDLGDL